MSDLFDLPFEDEDLPPEVEEPPRIPAAIPARSTASPAGSPSALAASPQPGRTVLSVTDLTIRVRDQLESSFFEVWVEGELSNCRLWNTGHLYFTLKDSQSQLKGVIFRSALRYLKFKPADGLRVIARGRVSVYEPKGEYQLVCEHLEPHGLGALQLAFEQLKKRLQAEGLFDQDRKRPLPALPRRIGIVTSLDGAAIRDIIKVLARRHASASLVIRPARVQGEDAAADIASALNAIGRVPGVEVVIVGRGGGSMEDLWAFNEERVARAIARCPVPVISAVGHETDVTIADFVADLRAPTPSAAAEMVVAATDQFTTRIDGLHDRLRAAARARVQGLSRRVHTLDSRPAFAGIPARVAMRGRYASDLTHTLARAMRERIALRDRRLQTMRRQLDTLNLGRRLGSIRTRLATADGRIDGAIASQRHRAGSRLRESVSRLEALSPLGVLGRGYAVCWNADRTAVIRDASSAALGDRVRVTLAKGELECQVQKQTTDFTDTNGGHG